MTTEHDALAAVAAGAHAVGVLVDLAYRSEDELTASAAARIVAALPPFASGTLVTHATDLDRVTALCREVRPHVVQLHGDFRVADVATLRAAVPRVVIVKTVHVIDAGAVEAARDAARYADAVLLDSRTAGRLGGTGVPHDWAISARIRTALDGCPVVLAGGLTPDNVAEAIRLVRPYAVDVNSGVSERCSVKSRSRMDAFVAAVRSADLCPR